MKNDLTCGIVQDLLPNYIEDLTSAETNEAVEAHLEKCGGCKKIYEEMSVDLDRMSEVPNAELKFLKKFKLIRVLAAGLCVVLTLILSFLVYGGEYQYTLDRESLTRAVNEFMEIEYYEWNAYVLEHVKLDSYVIVSFKDQATSTINGVLILKKGINQKYRGLEVSVESSENSPNIQLHSIEIKGKEYIVVNGFKLREEIGYYGIDYIGYTSKGSLAKDRVSKTIKIKVKNQQFLDIYTREELNQRFLENEERGLYNYLPISISIYDLDGVDVTGKYGSKKEEKGVSFNGGIVDQFLIYFLMGIIFFVGIIMTRYFLLDSRK